MRQSLMKSLRVTFFGDPAKVVQCYQIEIPTPGDNEILVRMIKSSINWSDLLTIQGTYKSRTQLPFFPGFEGVGIVAALGAGVGGLAEGDRVLALRGKGTWQEYTLLPAEEAIPVPKEISDEMAAQLYVNPLTAWLIIQKLKIKPGEYVLVNACGSAIGKFFCQLAKNFGFKLIALVRDSRHCENLLSLGATAVINENEVDLYSKINHASKGEAIYHGLDAVGGFSGSQLLRCLTEPGHFIQYGLLSGQIIDAYLNPGSQGHIKREDFHLREWVYRTDIVERKAEFNNMFKHIIEHHITLPVSKEYPLDEAEAAITHSITAGKTGKVLFKM